MTSFNKFAVAACLMLSLGLGFVLPPACRAQEPWRTLEGHKGSVRSVALSPDSKRLASAGEDGTVRLWDTEKGKQLFILDKGLGWPSLLGFLQGGKVLLVKAASEEAKGDGFALFWWDLEKRKIMQRKVIRRHKLAIYLVVVLSSDGKALAVGGEEKDSTVKILDAETGKELTKLRGEHDPFQAKFSADGRLLVVVGYTAPFPREFPRPPGTVITERLRVWDLRTGKTVDSFTLTRKSDFVFSPDGKTLALCNADEGTWHHYILACDLTGKRAPRRLPNWQWPVDSLDSTPDGKWLVVTWPGALRVLDATTGERVKWSLPYGSAERPPALAISKDGKLIAAPDGCEDKINLWRLEDVPPKAKQTKRK